MFLKYPNPAKKKTGFSDLLILLLIIIVAIPIYGLFVVAPEMNKKDQQTSINQENLDALMGDECRKGYAVELLKKEDGFISIADYDSIVLKCRSEAMESSVSRRAAETTRKQQLDALTSEK